MIDQKNDPPVILDKDGEPMIQWVEAPPKKPKPPKDYSKSYNAFIRAANGMLPFIGERYRPAVAGFLAFLAILGGTVFFVEQDVEDNTVPASPTVERTIEPTVSPTP